MDDLERVRFLGRYFPHLQGLKLIPLSLAILVGIWTKQYWAMASGTATLSGCFLFLLFILAVVLLYQRIGVYYRRRFGYVEPQIDESSRLWKGLLWGMLLGPFWIALSWIEYWIDSPVSLTGLGLAAFFACPWLEPDGRRFFPHYGVIAAVLAVLSLLPMLDFTPPREIYEEQLYRDGVHTTLGLALLVSGLLNHRLLVRSLPHPKLEESLENPV